LLLGATVDASSPDVAAPSSSAPAVVVSPAAASGADAAAGGARPRRRERESMVRLVATDEGSRFRVALELLPDDLADR